MFLEPRLWTPLPKPQAVQSSMGPQRCDLCGVQDTIGIIEDCDKVNEVFSKPSLFLRPTHFSASVIAPPSVLPPSRSCKVAPPHSEFPSRDLIFRQSTLYS
ncbi:hypothetical protein Mapa_016071 [Marchantia paleacea]|nr:hypothetical protein Mapa_016071 [Marchantia paleacea]